MYICGMNTQTTIPKRDGQYPLCPTCFSPRIFAVGTNTAGMNIVCRDCESLFAASQITGYGLSDDGGPRKCACGVVHYGLTTTCFRCTQQEVV